MNDVRPALSTPARPSAPVLSGVRRTTLRAQFSLVIFLLAFLPNLVLGLRAQPDLPGAALFAWMALVALLCGLVGYLLSGALLRPLSRLETEVERGNFAQCHPDDPTEIQALRGAFTGLMERLSTEQERRGAFMATLVHDLKTPLIATGHLTRTLTTLPLPDAERREIGAQIGAETARLLALVQQMADAHRFEREDVRLQVAPTDLRALLDGLARRMEPQARERGLTLHVGGHGHADVDASALERAVTNLTENALRYAASRVELQVTPAGVRVLDDGPGLQGQLRDLAQPFNGQQTTIAGQQYTAGTAGLGLFIARRIGEAHGGGLDYERHTERPTPPLDTPTSPRPLATLPPAAQSAFTLLLPEVQP